MGLRCVYLSRRRLLGHGLDHKHSSADFSPVSICGSTLYGRLKYVFDVASGARVGSDTPVVGDERTD